MMASRGKPPSDQPPSGLTAKHLDTLRVLFPDATIIPRVIEMGAGDLSHRKLVAVVETPDFRATFTFRRPV